MNEEIKEFFIPKDKDVRDLMDSGRSWVDHVVDCGSEQINPLIVVSGAGMDLKRGLYMFACGVDFTGPVEKRRFMKYVAAHCYENQHIIPIAAGLTSEAWLCKDPEARKNYLSIGDMPEHMRSEVAIISAMGNKINSEEWGLSLFDSREFERNEDGHIQWKGDWQNKDGGKGKAESYLLQYFFECFAGFGMKHENAEDYLSSFKQVEIMRG